MNKGSTLIVKKSCLNTRRNFPTTKIYHSAKFSYGKSSVRRIFLWKKFLVTEINDNGQCRICTTVLTNVVLHNVNRGKKWSFTQSLPGSLPNDRPSAKFLTCKDINEHYLCCATKVIECYHVELCGNPVSVMAILYVKTRNKTLSIRINNFLSLLFIQWCEFQNLVELYRYV